MTSLRDEKTYVWVVESGEYADRMTWMVTSSVEEAADALRQIYGPPYILKWDKPEPASQYRYVIRGHFETVPHMSMRGVSEWDCTRWEVDGGCPWRRNDDR